MPSSSEVRNDADRHLLANDLDRALRGYAALCLARPLDLDARLRIADTLLAAGEVQRAAEVYTALVRLAATIGYPLRALVAIKVLSALEPSLEELLRAMGELYASSSTRLGRSVRPALTDDEAPLDIDALVPAGDRPALVQAAWSAGIAAARVPVVPERLPPIPLLSELPAAAFASVLADTRLVRLRPGVPVIAEGEPGESFYVLARGTVRVSRRGTATDAPVELARLHDGSVFGEMALVSRAPRSATVTTVTDCDLLEFGRDALLAAARAAPSIAAALDKFTRERLLQNLLATSPLFRPLDRKQRFDLIRRFTAHEVSEGTVLIREGEPGRGLFVLLAGEVDVWKIDGAEKVLLATLRSGAVFGEMALVREGPTTATVAAAQPSTVLFLSRDYFQRLIEAVPVVRAYVESLSEERELDTNLILGGDAIEELDDDDLVRV